MEGRTAASHPAIELAFQTIGLGKQAIVFVDTKQGAEKAAEDIARRVRQGSQQELAIRLLNATSTPTRQCKRLAACARQGIAFHHSGLLPKQRHLIEQAFRDGLITIICATTTMAYGIDTPAFRVIMRSLKRFSGSWGADWIPTLEYHQMAGRAGRPKFHDTHGEAIAIAKTEAEQLEIEERYIFGKPEPMESKLAVEPVLRTYILSLIATGFVRTGQQISGFFARTFWAHQYKDQEKLGKILERMLALLGQWGFIQTPHGGFVSAADLGKETPFAATLLGRRVAELYIDPYTANQLINGLQNTRKNAPTPFALLQLISSALEMRPLLRLGAKDHDAVQAALLEHYNELLTAEPSTYDPAYDDFLNSVKTARFFEEWIDEKGEDELLEAYRIRPGEIHIKRGRAEWLLYAMEELAPLLRLHDIIKELRRLRIRVREGVREELLPLLRFEGVGRVRARRLHRAGLKDISDLKKADAALLARIIGKKTAESVKKQLGQEVTQVPSGRRKGQLGLGKFE